METKRPALSTTAGLQELLANNRSWASTRLAEDPDFFTRLAKRQAPPILFFGCSDSRKCLNSMIGTGPGELFVHRNIGNQVPLDDPNVQAVLEFGILNLKVKHVVVGGHTNCGGVTAALERQTMGAVGTWLKPMRQLAASHDSELLAISDRFERADRLSEINVLAQAENVLISPAYREARARGCAPEIHGWFFDLGTGLIRELDLPLDEWREKGLRS